MRKRTAEAPGKLTAQEAHIARLAGEELPNWEIAAVPYLSPQAVEWHLGKIFTKLGVSTRRQFAAVPPRRLAVAPCPVAGSFYAERPLVIRPGHLPRAASGPSAPVCAGLTLLLTSCWPLSMW